MKFVQTLPYVALATAFVLPDIDTLNQLALETSDAARSLWEEKPDTNSADILFGDLKVTSAKGDFRSALELAVDEELNAFEDVDESGHRRGGRRGRNGRRNSDQTIYQMICENSHSRKFSKLVDQYDDIVRMLNSTKASYTVFVPVDSAFEDLPDHGDKKPSKEFLEAVLRYHIGLDEYSARRLLTTETIPTALDEKYLGGRPQRLRTSVGFMGIKVNFYSNVIKGDIEAKNGVIHAVNHILMPPPFVGRELSMFPKVFSTLLHAYEKTNFIKFIHGIKADGTTVFAPTNRAFSKLGPRANEFLFNSEKGLGYLKALLKYQIVANATLYSDAYYDNLSGKRGYDDDNERIQHYDLPTLLHDLPIHVDIKRWEGFVSFWVNGFNRVEIRDAVARNGVIHVVEKLPIPPHKHRRGRGGRDDDRDDDDEEIDVEDLKLRLADYVDEEDKSSDWYDL